MIIATRSHFFHKGLVSFIEGGRLPYPPLRFGVMRVASFPFMFRENIPKPMELAMLAKKMLTAKMFWMDVPDAHMWDYTTLRAVCNLSETTCPSSRVMIRSAKAAYSGS